MLPISCLVIDLDSNLSSPEFLPVRNRRYPQFFFEQANKAAVVFKTAFRNDCVDGEAGFPEELAGQFKPQMRKILKWRC